ncbi:MAG: GNAT family N-acetyltransferase [Clostridia bacterium]|nr:GNAT family N-acetyltransferase [Clostridia bacterium]
MKIRTMKETDYPQLYGLWMRCRGMGLNDVDDSALGIARYLRRNPSTCFVAEEDGAVLGAIMAGHDGRRGFIYHTAVDPDCRRRGIGSKLVDAALRALRDEGIAKVALVVFSRNEAGNAFWAHQGFTLREDLCYRNLALTEIRRTDT